MLANSHQSCYAALANAKELELCTSPDLETLRRNCQQKLKKFKTKSIRPSVGNKKVDIVMVME